MPYNRTALKIISLDFPKCKDTLIEVKNNLQGNSSRMDEAENQINDLEYKEAKTNQPEQQEKSPKKWG